LAEEEKNSTPDNVQKKVEPANNETVMVENVKEEEMSQEEWEEKEQIAVGKSLFEKKCNKCHTFQSVLSKNRNLNEWKAIVEKMQKKDFIWILPAEVITISDYLFKINGTKEKGKELDTVFLIEH
jgi:hypothetical protein